MQPSMRYVVFLRRLKRLLCEYRLSSVSYRCACFAPLCYYRWGQWPRLHLGAGPRTVWWLTLGSSSRASGGGGWLGWGLYFVCERHELKNITKCGKQKKINQSSGSSRVLGNTLNSCFSFALNVYPIKKCWTMLSYMEARDLLHISFGIQESKYHLTYHTDTQHSYLHCR